MLCQGLNPRAGFFWGGREGCRSTVVQYFLLKWWLKRGGRGTSGSPHPSPHAAAGLASVSDVLCLLAMLCQYIFRVGGGRPLPGPQRAGGCLKGSGGLSSHSPRAGTGLVFAWAGCSQPGGSCAGGEGRRQSLLAGLKPAGEARRKPQGFFQGASKHLCEAGGGQREGLALGGDGWQGKKLAGRCPELPWHGGTAMEESYSRPAWVLEAGSGPGECRDVVTNTNNSLLLLFWL